MANPTSEKKAALLRPPPGWKVSVRTSGLYSGVESGQAVKFVKVGDAIVPSRFILEVQPEGAEDVAIAVQYEVIDGVLANTTLVTEGIDALQAADVLRKGMPLEAWGRYAITQLSTQMLLTQLIRQSDVPTLARLLKRPEEEAAAFADAVRSDWGGSLLIGLPGEEPVSVMDDSPLAEALAATRARFDTQGPASIVTTPSTPVRGKPRRNSVTKQHLHEVATVYREAVEAGKPPTKEVAERFAASHSTAARWVGMARTEGYLGAAKRGRSGEGTDSQ